MKRNKPLKTTKPLVRRSPITAAAKGASRSTLMRRADAAFSLFIRTRDSQQYNARYFRCISCGRILPIGMADNGHYVNRQHMSLRFSEQNCHAQCRHCNRFMEGNMQDYRKGLVEKIGEQKVELLEAQKHISTKISNFELALLAKHYMEETAKFEHQIK